MQKENRPIEPFSIEFKESAICTHTASKLTSPTNTENLSLQPSDAVLRILEDGAGYLRRGDLDRAASELASAASCAAKDGDQAGFGRALAQLAALEESRGELEAASGHNQSAQEIFLSIGDGAGLVQSFRVDGFLHFRQREYTAAAHSFGKALSLAIQLDGRLVLTTLDQVMPAAKHLVEADQVAALLPLGAALAQAVESSSPRQLPESREFAELAETVAGTLAPLGMMAEEHNLTDSKRRQLAARSTHQAWVVDALTKQRWGLAALVKDTLQTKLDFHEKLD